MALTPQQKEKLRQDALRLKSQIKPGTKSTDPAKAKQTQNEWAQYDAQFKKAAPAVQQSKSGPVAEKKPGFLQRTGDALKKRVVAVKDAFLSAKPDEDDTIVDKVTKPARAALRVVGNVAGGVSDVVGEGLVSGARIASKVTPDVIEKPIVNAGLNALQSKTGQKVTGVIQQGMESYQSFAEKHPEVAKDIEAVFNIAELIPFMKGKTLATRGLSALEKGTSAAKEGVEEALEVQTKRQAVRATAPKLTPTETVDALASGRGKKGLLGKVTIEPSKQELEAAEAVKHLVKPNKPVENIANIKAEIAKIGDGVEAELKKTPGIFNSTQLRSRLSEAKETSRVVFGTDQTLENAYDSIVDEMIRISDKYPKTLSGLLDARKEFDRVIDQKFPNILSGEAGDNVRRNAILDVRREANNYIAERLPDGNPFKEKLRQQSLMYRAVDNIASGAASSVNRSVVTKVMAAFHKNPVVTALTGAGVAFLTPALATPATLAVLMAGGAATIAGKVVTSKQFKQGLIKGLKVLQKQLKNPLINKNNLILEIEAVQKLIEQIKETKEE